MGSERGFGQGDQQTGITGTLVAKVFGWIVGTHMVSLFIQNLNAKLVLSRIKCKYPAASPPLRNSTEMEISLLPLSWHSLS